MKRDTFTDAISKIDAEIVEGFVTMDNALQAKRTKRKRLRQLWIRWGSAAACLLLAVCITLTFILMNPSQSGTEGEQSTPTDTPVIHDPQDVLQSFDPDRLIWGNSSLEYPGADFDDNAPQTEEVNEPEIADPAPGSDIRVDPVETDMTIWTEVFTEDDTQPNAQVEVTILWKGLHLYNSLYYAVSAAANEDVFAIVVYSRTSPSTALGKEENAESLLRPDLRFLASEGYYVVEHNGRTFIFADVTALAALSEVLSQYYTADVIGRIAFALATPEQLGIVSNDTLADDEVTFEESIGIMPPDTVVPNPSYLETTPVYPDTTDAYEEGTIAAETETVPVADTEYDIWETEASIPEMIA